MMTHSSDSQHASRRVASDASECWKLCGATAEFQWNDLYARVDVERPWLGLTSLRIRGHAVAGWLLGVSAAASAGELARAGDDVAAQWPPTEVYIRGRDLVATYRETAGQPFSLQVYWRAVETNDEQAAAVDAIISLQTPAWEAYPRIAVSSALPAELVGLDAKNSASDSPSAVEAIVLRSTSGWSYAEAPRGDDFAFALVEPTAEGLSRTCWQFAHEFMERGVIRRVHLRGAIVPTASDTAAAGGIRRLLITEQPPLTA